MVMIDFSKLDDYADNNNAYDENGEIIINDDAPADIIALYKQYREILDEEERTGVHIF